MTGGSAAKKVDLAKYVERRKLGPVVAKDGLLDLIEI